MMTVQTEYTQLCTKQVTLSSIKDPEICAKFISYVSEHEKYDVAVLLTRMDICRKTNRQSVGTNQNEFCDTMGLGQFLSF